MKFHLMPECFLTVLLYCLGTNIAYTQDVSITVKATEGKRAVSPYIYGRNNIFDKPAQFYKDADLRFARMNGGNNATKYNWKKKYQVIPTGIITYMAMIGIKHRKIFPQFILSCSKCMHSS